MVPGALSAQSTQAAQLETLRQDRRPLDTEGTIVHPYPQRRFDAKYSRVEPDALAAPIRICAGGAERSAFLSRPPEGLNQPRTILIDSGDFSQKNVEICEAARIDPLIAAGRAGHHQ